MNSSLKNIILLETKKNPHLGVRGISKLLKEKHKLNISKSTINNILRLKGIESQRGRKRHAIFYQRKYIKDCAHLLLKAVDSQIGLSDFLKGQLHAYFPHLNTNLLKKIILLFSFSSYVGADLERNIKRPGFLRLAGCYAYPAKSVKYFRRRLADYKPAIGLGKIKENAVLASTVKFYFLNNSTGFVDAKLTTLWDGLCNIEDFFLPLYHVASRLAQLQKDKIVVINYTKSFDYLSATTLNFINGLSTGIKRIEILDEKGKILERVEWNITNPAFLLGYYPKILSKGAVFLEKEKRFKRFINLNGEVLYAPILTRFLQAKGAKAVILNNILVKSKERLLPNWAILTDRKVNLGYFLRKYLHYWPYMEKAFLRDMKDIENFFLNKDTSKNLSKHIPEILNFEKEADFAEITAMLAAIFKEQFASLTFTGCAGEYIIGKDFCKIVIKNIAVNLKEKINNANLYLDNKRLFVA